MNLPLAVTVDDGETWITNLEEMQKIIVGVRHTPTLEEEYDLIQSYRGFLELKFGKKCTDNFRLVAWRKLGSKHHRCLNFLCPAWLKLTYQNLHPFVYSIFPST